MNPIGDPLDDISDAINSDNEVGDDPDVGRAYDPIDLQDGLHDGVADIGSKCS